MEEHDYVSVDSSLSELTTNDISSLSEPLSTAYTMQMEAELGTEQELMEEIELLDDRVMEVEGGNYRKQELKEEVELSSETCAGTEGEKEDLSTKPTKVTFPFRSLAIIYAIVCSDAIALNIVVPFITGKETVVEVGCF